MGSSTISLIRPYQRDPSCGRSFANPGNSAAFRGPLNPAALQHGANSALFNLYFKGLPVSFAQIPANKGARILLRISKSWFYSPHLSRWWVHSALARFSKKENLSQETSHYVFPARILPLQLSLSTWVHVSFRMERGETETRKCWKRNLSEFILAQTRYIVYISSRNRCLCGKRNRSYSQSRQNDSQSRRMLIFSSGFSNIYPRDNAIRRPQMFPRVRIISDFNALEKPK